MLVFQARPALSADLPRPLPRMLVFRPARRPLYPVDTARSASAANPRTPPLPVTKFHGATPATGAYALSAALLSQGTGDRALSAARPATGARASSAAPLTYGIIQATRVYASCAAPLSLSTGARASTSAAPLSHAPRNSKTAAPARRSFRRRFPPLPHPGHAVAVGFRCGKADTETATSRLQLDSAFSRNSGGLFTPFLIKEELIRLTTSSPFPSRSTGKKPSPVGPLSPFLKASTWSASALSSSRTIPHVRSTLSDPAEQEKHDTARRASGDSTASGQISRTAYPPKAEESQLSSSRAGSEPPAPPWPNKETIGHSKSTFWPLFAYLSAAVIEVPQQPSKARKPRYNSRASSFSLRDRNGASACGFVSVRVSARVIVGSYSSRN